MAKPNFYPHLHYFRGISILFIVAAHCWSAPIFILNNNDLPAHLAPLFNVLEVLFHGSTVFFAMISGMLFSLVLKDKGYRRFYRNKITNVLLPYLVSCCCYVLVWHLLGFTEFEKYSMTQILGFFAYATATGQMAMHLWYIPIVLLLFAITPILAWMVDTRQRVLMVLLFLAPLLISRVWPDFSLATLVYFIAPYLAGMLIGKHLDDMEQWIQKMQAIFVSLFILLSVGYYFLLKYNVKYVDVLYLSVNIQETVTYIIRMSSALVALRLLQLGVRAVPAWVDMLANNAFAIYFIHMSILLFMIFGIKETTYQPSSVWGTFMFGLGGFVLSLSLSLVMAYAVKRVTGKYSRMLIGA